MVNHLDADTDTLSESEARDVLRSVGWLSQTPAAFAERILRASSLVSLGPDVPVYHVGDKPGGIYGLARGSVSVWIAPQERGPSFGHLMRPGQWIGLASAARRQVRAVELRTTRSSELLLLSITKFDAIVADDPGVWRHFTDLALLNGSIALTAADDLMIRDPIKRCAAVLLRLAGLRGAADMAPAVPRIDLAQDMLGHLANLSRNAVGKILRDFEDKGWIELHYRHILILQGPMLNLALTDVNDD